MPNFFDNDKKMRDQIYNISPSESHKNIEKLNHNDLTSVHNYISGYNNANYKIKSIEFTRKVADYPIQNNVLSVKDNSEREGMTFILEQDY
ncbi:MAG: hypothetical protein ACK5KT_15545 [Dysgonomonas sp.]